MDMERITLTFANARALLAELRGLGRNLHVGRFEALRGRGYHAHLLGLMEKRLRSDAHGGQLALTFEVIYGHAIKPRPRPGLAAHTAVSLDDMRAMLRPGA